MDQKDRRLSWRGRAYSENCSVKRPHCRCGWLRFFGLRLRVLTLNGHGMRCTGSLHWKPIGEGVTSNPKALRRVTQSRHCNLLDLGCKHLVVSSRSPGPRDTGELFPSNRPNVAPCRASDRPGNRIRRAFKPHNSGPCHAERSEASSKKPRRAPARPSWILHFAQNDNPSVKTRPNRTDSNAVFFPDLARGSGS